MKIITRGYFITDPGDIDKGAKPMNCIVTTSRNFEFDSYKEQTKFESFLKRAFMITSKSKKIAIMTLETSDKIEEEINKD